MKKATVPKLLAYYFVLSFVSNLVHPITPMFLQSINCPESMFGIAFATMALANFFMAPFWGRIGDIYGYVKALSFATIGYTMGQLIFSQANGVVQVLLGRFVAGAFLSGHQVSVMAFLSAATTDDQEKANYMAIFAALTSVGVSLGYFIGGFLGDFSLNTWGNVRPIFYTQAAGFALALILIWPLIGELKIEQQGLKLDLNDLNPLTGIKKTLPLISGPLTLFLFTSFLTSFATNAHDQSFNYYLRARLDFPPSYNGTFKAIVGIIALLVNLTFNIWLAKKTDLRKSIIPFLLVCSGSIVFMIMAKDNITFMASALVFYLANAIYLPIQQGLIVRNTQGAEGEISGLFNGARALGMCLGPLFSGLVFTFDPTFPFKTSSFVFLLAAFLSFYNYFQYKKQRASLM